MPNHLSALAAAVVGLASQAGPQATLLLGLDTDQGLHVRMTYAALETERLPPDRVAHRAPLQTLVVHRDGDAVTAEQVPFLAIPLAQGFRFMTLEVRERSNPRYRPVRVAPPAGAVRDPERTSRLASCEIRPRVHGRAADLRAALTRTPAPVHAIEVTYEVPRWVTPRFYLTLAAKQVSNGGASGFTSEDATALVPLAPGFPVTTDQLRPWLDAGAFRDVVVAAAGAWYRDWDPTTPLPWSVVAEALEPVSFSFVHGGGALRLEALVPLAHNAARSGLAKQPLGMPPALAAALGLPAPGAAPDLGSPAAQDAFRSPDGTTLVRLTADPVEVLDAATLRLLGVFPRPPGLRRVLMEEWALGRFADGWPGGLRSTAAAVGPVTGWRLIP